MIQSFNPEIYPILIHVAFGEPIESIKQKYSFNDTIDDDIFENAYAFVSEVYTNTDDRIVLVSFQDKTITPGIIAHESVHVASTIFNLCGMSMGFELGQDEHYAYLVGWITNKIHSLI